jgi:hypothetical protein
VDVNHRQMSVYLGLCKLTGDTEASVVDEDIKGSQLGDPPFDPSNIHSIGQIGH